MGLRTERLGASEFETITLEASAQFAFTSVLLWHLAHLPGLKVIAKKSWALTDDFEAYFIYKGRLFVLQTPFVNPWVSLLGQPPDEQLFSEVESQVQSFPQWLHLLTPLAILRYIFTPFNPPLALLHQHGAMPKLESGSGKNAL